MNFKTTFVCFVLFHWLHLNSVFGQGCSQYVAYDCANTTWINSQNDYTLSLSAYKTFSGSDGWIQFTGDNSQMSCRATRSCEKLKFVKDATTLYCHGDSACNKISTIKVDGGSSNYNGSLKCWGPNTCGNVNSMTSSDYCDCLADFSCAYSNIVCKDGWFGGAYSMYNSKIESPGDGSNNVKYRFSGYFAGYNSSLTCNSGDTCYIKCYGNGCTNLIVDCVDASQCYFDCDDSELRTCPTLISNVNWTAVNNNNNNNNFDFLVDTLTLSENKETLCNYGLGSLLYDDAYAFVDYSLTDVSTTDEDSSICCRGAFSCSGETYVFNGGTITGVSSLSTGAADSDIICSTYGCDSTTMDSSNNIYCDGYEACAYATITAKNNIYCQSAVSCAGADINNANIVYCLSQQACDGATMNNINTVYILSDPIEFTVTAFITSSGGSDYVTSNDANYENINDTTTTVNLMTYESGDNVLIKCSNNDRCRINCLVNGACGDTYPTLICNGECIICCNDTLGITCPSTSTISGTGTWIFDDTSICQSSLASHSIRTNAINDSINIASVFTTTIDTTTIAPTTTIPTTTATTDSGTTVGVKSTLTMTNTNVESSQDTQEESTTTETGGSGNNNGQGNNNNDSSSSSSDSGLSPALQLIIGAIGGAIVMFISFVICVRLVHRYEKRQNDKDNRNYLGSTSKSTNGVAIEAVSIDANNNNNNSSNNNQKKKQLWGKKNKNENNNAIVATRDQENDGEEDHIGQPVNNNEINGSGDNLMVVDDGQPNMLNNNDINMINHMNMMNMMNQMNESLKNLQNFQNNMAMGMNNNNNNINNMNNMNNMNMAGMDMNGMNGMNGMNNMDAAMNIAAMSMNMGAMNMNMGGMNMNMNMNMNMGGMNNNNFNNINSLLPLNAVKSLSSSAEMDGNPVIDPSAIISSTPNGIINNNNNNGHMHMNHVNLSNKNNNNNNNNNQFVNMHDDDSSSDEVMENLRMRVGKNKNILNENNQASSNVNVNDGDDGDGDGDDDVDLKGITPYS